MKGKIKEYLRRFTNHRELVSYEIGSDGIITAKVITQRGDDAEVIFIITPADKKIKLEYGIRKDEKNIIVDKKFFNR